MYAIVTSRFAGLLCQHGLQAQGGGRVNFPEGLKLLQFYAEFSAAQSFYYLRAVKH